MSLGTITYGEMITQVKNWIKTNCWNIANYANIPACFKSGFYINGNCAMDTHAAYYNSTYTLYITGYDVAQVTSDVVDAQMLNFWTDYCGNISVGLPITPTNYLAFIQDMTSFCSARIYMAVSQFSADKYLVYNAGSATYLDYKALTANQQSYKIINASDVAYQSQGILINIIDAVNQAIRIFPTRYDVTLT